MNSNQNSKAQRTKRHILETVAPVFNKRGYSGTSLSDITQATGLTKGGIYCNFKNKDELALASFEYNFDRIRTYIQREVAAEKTNLGKLLAYPRGYRKAFAEMAGMGGCPVANTAVDADDTHHDLHLLVMEAIDTWRDALIMLVERGKTKGEIRSDADSEKLAETVISLVEGGSIMAKTTGRESFLFHALDQIEAVILAAKTE